MGMNTESAILDTLYHHFTSHPGQPKMILSALYESIDVSPNDGDGVGEACRQLFSLRRKGWVEYQFLEDGSGGVVEITSEGIRIAEDRQQSVFPIPEPETPGPIQDPGIEAVIPEPCPATLEGVVQADRACARLFQRHDVLDEIKMLFGQASSTCHFVVLYGEPMVGKTRILKRLSEVLGDEYIPLRVTSQGLGLSALGDLDAFAVDLAVQLQVKFKKWTDRHNILSPSVPDRKAFQDGRGVRAFYTYWDELGQQTGNRRPVVMFDEIERLLDHEDRLNQQILTFLDDFVCNLENGCVIVAGSERILQLRNELFEILIGRGRPIRVHYYDKEAVSLVFSAIQKYFTFEEDVLHYLAALSDGHPRLLSAAYQATRSLGKRNVGRGDIDPILGKFVDLTNPILRQLLQRLTSDERAVVWLISQTVSDLADGWDYSLHTLAESASHLPTEPGLDYDLQRGIDRLTEREWVDWKNQEEGLFHFRLGIFPLWMHRHHISPTL